MDWGALAGALGGPIGAAIAGGFGLKGQRETNQTNRAIADQNVEYQKERAEIEDKRYEDETAYNRAWAENEREYQRSLQDEIFAREDTAIERQASQLSALGINPLSQNMSGIAAGQALNAPTAPQASAQDAEAAHNDYQMQNEFNSVLSAITPLMSMADSINGITTGSTQRDLLRKQADAQALANQEKEMDNLIKAKEYGIKIDDDGNLSIQDFNHTKQDFSDVEYRDKNASANRNEREDAFQNEYKTHDNSPKEELLLTALENQAENNNILGRGVAQGAKAYHQFTHPIQTGITVLGALAAGKIKQFINRKKKAANGKDDFAWAKNWLKNNNHR